MCEDFKRYLRNWVTYWKKILNGGIKGEERKRKRKNFMRLYNKFRVGKIWKSIALAWNEIHKSMPYTKILLWLFIVTQIFHTTNWILPKTAKTKNEIYDCNHWETTCNHVRVKSVNWASGEWKPWESWESSLSLFFFFCLCHYFKMYDSVYRFYLYSFLLNSYFPISVHAYDCQLKRCFSIWPLGGTLLAHIAVRPIQQGSLQSAVR